jgi:hypothetical protein
VGEPPAGEAGLESIHLCSLFRPLGENGAANGDREEGDAEVVWTGEATGAAVRVAAGPGVGTGVGLVDGKTPGTGVGSRAIFSCWEIIPSIIY